MKTAISVPDDIFAAGEHVAKRLGISRSELYARAMAAFVREYGGEAVTSRINRVLGDTPPRRLGPSMARVQALSLGPDEGDLDDWVDLDRVRRGKKRG